MVASPKILFCYLPLCVRIVQDKFQTAMPIFGILVIFYFSLHNFARAIYQNVQKLIFEVCGTFWQLFIIAHHFQHNFSNKKTLTRSWPPGGAWDPPLPTRLLDFYVSGCSIFHVNNPKNYMYLAANPHLTICCPRDLPQKQRFELKCSLCNKF